MGATTCGAVLDRVNSLVAAQGFSRAKDAFDFDRQPAQAAHAIYRIEATRQTSPGYVGNAQEERHRVDVWFARLVRTDPHGAIRQLKSDSDLVEQALYDDYAAFDYLVEEASVEGECRLPQPEADYVIARLSATVNFDRAL